MHHEFCPVGDQFSQGLLIQAHLPDSLPRHHQGCAAACRTSCRGPSARGSLQRPTLPHRQPPRPAARTAPRPAAGTRRTLPSRARCATATRTRTRACTRPGQQGYETLVPAVCHVIDVLYCHGRAQGGGSWLAMRCGGFISCCICACITCTRTGCCSGCWRCSTAFAPVHEGISYCLQSCRLRA